MKSLIDIVESLIIDESFQSSILRELITDVKANYKGRNVEMLPHGIAWDKIPDSEVIYGESMDNDFIKKFVKSDNYFILWYPLIRKKFKSGRVNARWNNDYYLAPGEVIITCKNQFVKYDSHASKWETSFKTDCTSLVPAKDTYDNDVQYQAKLAKNAKERNAANNALSTDSELYTQSIKNGVGFVGGQLSVELLSENTICSCIALSKETIAKYSTIELMNQRYNAKADSVADMRELISDREKSKINHQQWRGSSWDVETKKGAIDYPMIRKANIERYKKMMGQSKGIKLLEKYAPKIKAIRDAIDEYSKGTMVVPSAIKSIAGDKFVDIFFNNVSNADKRIAERINRMQSYYTDALDSIDYICQIYNGTKEINSYDTHWNENIEQAKKRILDSRIEKINTDIDVCNTAIKEIKSFMQ